MVLSVAAPVAGEVASQAGEQAVQQSRPQAAGLQVGHGNLTYQPQRQGGQPPKNTTGPGADSGPPLHTGAPDLY